MTTECNYTHFQAIQHFLRHCIWLHLRQLRNERRQLGIGEQYIVRYASCMRPA